jgi:fibronectin-binding autotransporter adhesin
MKKTLISKTAGRIGLLAASALLVALPAAQADQVKNSQALPLDDVNAWVGLAVPGPTELAIFDSNIGTNPITCGISGALNIKGIVCSNNMGTNFIIVAGGSLTNGASGIDMSAANKNFTIQAQPFALNANQTWDVGSNTLALQNCTLNFGANTLNINSTGGGGTVVMPGSHSGTGAWTIGAGATVKLSNGGAPYPNNTTTVNSGGVLDINNVNATVATATINLNGLGINGGGALISSGAGFLNGPAVVLQSDSAVGGAANFTWNTGSPISGSGNLIKVGASALTIPSTCTFNGGVTVSNGSLTLSGANSFPGGVNLNAGTLKVGSATALGSAAGTLTIAGGTTLDATVATTIANNNPMVINGDFTFTGTANLIMGTNTATLGTAAGDTRTITVSGNALRLGSLVNGTTATNLVKMGGGILYVQTTNSTFLSGSMTVSNGTLSVANFNASAPLTVPGAIAIWGTANKFQPGDIANCTTIYNGNIVGNGIVANFSQGLAVFGGDNSAFTGQFRVFRYGKLTNAKGVGGTLYMDRTYNDAYLDLNGLAVTGVDAIFSNIEGQGGTRQARLRNSNTGSQASFAGNITTTTTNNVGVDGAGDMLLSGTISGTNGLNMLGTGTLTLSVSNSFTGAVSLTGGTINVNTNSALGNGGNVNVNGGNLDNTSGSAVTVGNPLTVSQSFTFGGTGNSSLSFGSGAVNFGSAAKTITVNNAGTLTLGGAAIGGSSALTKAGTGTLVLSGSSSTMTKPIVVTNGTLIVNGAIGTNTVTVSTNATLGGTGTIGGNVTFNLGAMALFTNGSTLTISNSLTANGNVVKLNLPANLGQGTYLLATYNPTGSSGSFASTPVIANGGSFAANTTNYITTGGGQVNLVVVNTYTVTYNGNSSDGGTVPVDGNAYTNGATVTVLGNTGSLTKTGYNFANWNTAANGSGTSYNPAATFAIAANTTLYAQWTPSTPSATNITYTVSGGQLVLEWPNGQGWQLQAQTNSLNAGITTNWSTISGATSPFTNTIDAANPTVFYRLTYP